MMIGCTFGIMIANLTNLYEDIEDEGAEPSYIHLIICFIYFVIYVGLFNVRFLTNFIIREVL